MDFANNIISNDFEDKYPDIKKIHKKIYDILYQINDLEPEQRQANLLEILKKDYALSLDELSVLKGYLPDGFMMVDKKGSEEEKLHTLAVSPNFIPLSSKQIKDLSDKQREIYLKVYSAYSLITRYRFGVARDPGFADFDDEEPQKNYQERMGVIGYTQTEGKLVPTLTISFINVEQGLKVTRFAAAKPKTGFGELFFKNSQKIADRASKTDHTLPQDGYIEARAGYSLPNNAYNKYLSSIKKQMDEVVLDKTNEKYINLVRQHISGIDEEQAKIMAKALQIHLNSSPSTTEHMHQAYTASLDRVDCGFVPGGILFNHGYDNILLYRNQFLTQDRRLLRQAIKKLTPLVEKFMVQQFLFAYLINGVKNNNLDAQALIEQKKQILLTTHQKMQDTLNHFIQEARLKNFYKRKRKLRQARRNQKVQKRR